MATLNRDILQQMAATRLEDAKVLLGQGRYAAAYYLAGYAVECGLKACFARQVREHDFPEKGKSERVFQHDFMQLIALVSFTIPSEYRSSEEDASTAPTTLWGALSEDFKINPALEDNWNTVKAWKEDSLYDPLWLSDARAMQTKAENMLRAIADDENGVLPWLARYW